MDKKLISPVVAIVQARMNSRSIPGKVMREIYGKPMLFHVVNRLKASELIDEIAVATSIDPTDSVIENWCTDNGIACVRGSLDDVLGRYFIAAKSLEAKTIVRVTAECPLIDPRLVDRIISRFSEGGYDHVCVDSSFPEGLDAEVFSFEALELAYTDAIMASERRHVTPYIWKRPQVFRLSTVSSHENLSFMRWTVDDERDFVFVQSVFKGLGKEDKVFGTEEILDFLRAHPGLNKLNAGTRRNEAYAKSIREDYVVGAHNASEYKTAIQ